MTKIGYRRTETTKRPRYGPRIGGKKEHIRIVEAALGREIRAPEQVHHVNRIKTDNARGNLVLCPDGSYHQLLEIRGDAWRACGNANWRKCFRCGKWDDPKNLIIADRRGTSHPTRNRSGQLDVVHEERGGVCVDLSEPRPVNSGRCPVSPVGRHSTGSRRKARKRGEYTDRALQRQCIHCDQPIRRSHPLATRWYAVSPFGERETPNQERP